MRYGFIGDVVIFYSYRENIRDSCSVLKNIIKYSDHNFLTLVPKLISFVTFDNYLRFT